MVSSRQFFENAVASLLDIKESLDASSPVSNVEYKAYVEPSEGGKMQAGYIRNSNDLFPGADNEDIGLPGQTTIAIEIHNRGGEKTPVATFNRLSAGRDAGESFEEGYVYYETVCHLEFNHDTHTVSLFDGISDEEPNRQFTQPDLDDFITAITDMIRREPSYIPESSAPASRVTSQP